MNLEQIEYIKEIVTTKSISLAAQNLHVSQSAVSQSLALLEKELEVKLFKRSRIGTIPTEEGKNIIKKALEIIQKIDEIKEEAQFINSSFKGELKIASTPSFLMSLLPHILSSFKKDFPQIKVTIIETGGSSTIKKVNNNIVDLGFMYFNKNVKKESLDNLIYRYFYRKQDIKIILPKNSPLAYNETVKSEELFNYPVVIHSSEFWRNVIADFKKGNDSINVLFETTNSELIKKTVSEGLAFGMLPSFMLKDDPYVESKRIIPVSLVDYEFDPVFKFACIYSTKSNNKRIIKKFLKYLELANL